MSKKWIVENCYETKETVKIAVDTLMFILFITLCCLNATGIVYYEAEGVTLLGLVGAHLF